MGKNNELGGIFYEAYFSVFDSTLPDVCFFVTESFAANRVLVAYFSATGTTKKLAEYAADTVGADLFEIVPETPYSDADINWHDRNSRSSIEQNDPSARPAIRRRVGDMSNYDIVFVGYPIWWGETPQIIKTFMESYDFSGKTLVPFCTSGSSGIGASAKHLQPITSSSAKWLNGARLRSNTSRAGMADWINNLGLDIQAK